MSMNRYQRILAIIVNIILILGFASGCAKPLVVDYDYDTTYDFSKLKTYSWMQSAPGNQMEDLVEKRIRQSVATQLGKRGYSQSNEAPDFLISLQGVKKTVETGSVGVGASVGVPVGSRGSMSIGMGKSKPRVKQEGTLYLDFVDPKSGTAIWKGTATAAIQSGSSPEEQQQRINEVIGTLLSKFPPQPAKQ